LAINLIRAKNGRDLVDRARFAKVKKIVQYE